MWIIASIPFWLIGASLFGIAIFGGVRCLRADKTTDDVKTTALGIAAFMVGAALFLMIAAKVAS